jgi:hypothetical protein
MTTEKALRRIEKWCREEERLRGVKLTLRGEKGGAPMLGANGEIRGIVMACGEIRALCRALRREHRMEARGR